jgi:signal transduction histidine kinase
MIKSIRWRLFISISLLTGFFVFFSWVLNTLYLGKYYISSKKSTLVDNYKMINEIYKGDPLEIAMDLERIGRTTGIDITIIGSDNTRKFSSSSRIINRPGREIEHNPMVNMIMSKAQTLSAGEYIIETVNDRRINTEFLNLLAKFGNGDYILLNTPLQAIQQNVEITNKFFIFTGLLTIIIGMILVYFYSRRFTRPILELSDIAQRMAKLDFSKKYTDHNQDEIGELGESINSLSVQLDKSISELHEANAKLLEDIERERKIDTMRKEFVSNVSHELKTPISLIQGYAEGLKVNVVDDEENKNYYCEVIIDESKKMDKLVKDLLQLSLYESGYFKIEKTTFDLSKLLDSIIDKYHIIFSDKNISLEVTKEEQILANGDIDRIEQVLVNYLNNALDHLDENKVLKITVAKENGKAKIGIYNSGKAIPEEELSDIWKSFYKVDKARTRAYGGTGLGLSIVHAIMELHQNNCGVYNTQQGVEFWFELDMFS